MRDDSGGMGVRVRDSTLTMTLARFILVTAGVLVLLSGCANLYNKQYRRADHSHVVGSESEYDLYFVEADDEGWFWEPAQADRALDAIKRSAAGQDTLVVTFVHGWHHSSACCDGNVEGFKEVLSQLHLELQKPMYAAARLQIHGRPEPLHVIGIYMGWRGRSLPGLLDYLTFWGRKSSAERTGDADFQEFMVRLKNLYYGAVAPTPAGATGNKLFGLVTIGHSFGGQVVLRSTASFLEHRLTDLNDQARGYLHMPVPAPSAGPVLTDPVTGFGDMVVLVNPAVEAAAYQRMFSLGQQLRYGESQTPLMLTLSADNDVPRKKFFTIGREFGEFFMNRPRKDDPRERDLERTALGFYAEQVTHRLAPVNMETIVTTSVHHLPDPGCSETGCSVDWNEWRSRMPVSGSHEQVILPPSTQDTLSADRSKETLEKLVTYDFSGPTTLDDIVLSPTQGAIPYQAFIVASVDPAIIDGHNGMFAGPLVRFLVKYIALVEAKTMLPRLQAAAAP